MIQSRLENLRGTTVVLGRAEHDDRFRDLSLVAHRQKAYLLVEIDPVHADRGQHENRQQSDPFENAPSHLNTSLNSASAIGPSRRSRAGVCGKVQQSGASSRGKFAPIDEHLERVPKLCSHFLRRNGRRHSAAIGTRRRNGPTQGRKQALRKDGASPSGHRSFQFLLSPSGDRLRVPAGSSSTGPARIVPPAQAHVSERLATLLAISMEFTSSKDRLCSPHGP